MSSQDTELELCRTIQHTLTVRLLGHSVSKNNGLAEKWRFIQKKKGILLEYPTILILTLTLILTQT